MANGTLDDNKELFKEMLNDDPHLKCFHIVLDGPTGVTYDNYVLAKTADDAVDFSLDRMSQVKSNDFSCTLTREVKL